MRYLILTVGTPACGKSTWIENNNLKQYTICPDDIRLLIESPRIDVNGDYYISQKNDKRVWEFVFELIEERMKRGEFIVVDATHSRSKLINKYKKLVEKYRYRIIAVDFRLLNLSLDEILERNRNRKPDYKKVPEDAIKNIYERLKTMKIPSGVKSIHPNEFKSLTNILFDMNGKYDHIVVIGDIHGCDTELGKLFNKIMNKINSFESTLFIFVGDYFDRGNENYKVFGRLYGMMQNKNVLFLTGNHEFNRLPLYSEFYKLKKDGKDKELKELIRKHIRSSATAATFNEFYTHGLNPKNVNNFYKRLGQLAYFKFGDKIYIITHGGIPNIPTIFQPTEDFIYGVGEYEDSDKIAETFMKNTSDEYIQIHGHRNIFNRDPFYFDRVFNINGDAEYVGGKLRAIIIDKNNNHTLVEQESINGALERNNNVSIYVENVELSENTSILETMKKHSFVKVKEHENNIFSCNFTNKAFFTGKWDSITIKARGLFIGLDKDNNEHILVRGYNKFFNLNERPETMLRNLSSLKYPVKLYMKYNGFLGLLSVDKRKEYYGEWLITTKGSTTGPFVDMFKEIITPHLTDSLKQYILANDVTLAFEVMHLNDKHIVDFNENQVILLDAIKNNIHGDRLDYNELVRISEQFGFKCKELVTTLNSYSELYRLIDNMEKQNVFTDDGIEGYVAEDMNGFMVKLKSRWYKFWKWVRRFKEDMKKIDFDRRDLLVKKKHMLHTYEENVIYNFILENGKDALDKHVIEFRKDVLNSIASNNG